MFEQAIYDERPQNSQVNKICRSSRTGDILDRKISEYAVVEQIVHLIRFDYIERYPRAANGSL